MYNYSKIVTIIWFSTIKKSITVSMLKLWILWFQFIIWGWGGLVAVILNSWSSKFYITRVVKQSFKMFFSNSVKLQEGRAPNLIILI